jgi:hypothetical protein
MLEVMTMSISNIPKISKRRIRFVRLCALIIGLGLAATGARAEHLSMVLGADGQLYSATAGLYGTLFPGSTAYPASTPVLALDTVTAGGKPQRQLVQSTDNADTESAPALIYEDGSKTLFVVWIAGSDSLNWFIKLASYTGGQWSPSITILSNPYALKTPPQLALTRDAHQEADPTNGKPVTHHRTVLHIVWSEDSSSGRYQTFYEPVIFEDGAWIGTVPAPLHLNDLDAAEQTVPAGSGPVVTPLVYTPTVQSGRDLSTAVAGFASETSGMLTVVEIDVLPEELRILADVCAGAVTSNGATHFPNQLSSIANAAQNAILGAGGAFQPEALQPIVTDVQQQILGGAADLTTLATKARATVIETGKRFSVRGLRPFVPGLGVVAPPEVTEVIPPNGPSQFIQFRVASTRQVPTVAINGLQLYLSRAGTDALAAWTSADNGSLFYTSTQPDGTWSSPLKLQLSSTLDLQHAQQVLQQRIQ